MKKYFIFFSLLVSIIAAFTPMTAQAQQPGNDAMYFWRNDSDLNAFLFDEVDSITFSKVGLDDRTYPNVVVKVIWTPDSVYRIPIAAIDSVSVNVPEPKYLDDVFHIRDFHYPYVIDATDSTVTFNASIPTDSLPRLRQVVVCDTAFVEPFENGFAGRVINIVRSSNSVRIECEEVGIEDVFEYLVKTGKTVTYIDDGTSPRAPRRLNKNGTIAIPFGEFSLDLYKEGPQHVELSVAPELSFNYIICYNHPGQENRIKFEVTKKFDCHLLADLNTDLIEWHTPNEALYPINVPIPTGIPPLNAAVRIGPYISLSGTAKASLDLPFKYQSNIGFDTATGLICNFDGTSFSSPIGSANLQFEAFAGMAVVVDVSLLSKKVAGTGITLTLGPKFTANLEFNTDNMASFNYMMKDSYVNFQPISASVTGDVSIFGKKNKWTWSLDSLFNNVPLFQERKYYLYPNFTEPALPPLDSQGISLTALSSDIKHANQSSATNESQGRNLIFPVTPGIRITSVTDDNRKYTKFSESPYKRWNEWDNNFLQMELDGEYPNGSYVARPVFKIFNNIVEAGPGEIVRIPEAWSLSDETIVIKKNVTKYIDFMGGWGSYSLYNNSLSVCDAEFVSNDGLVSSTTWPPIDVSGYEDQIPRIKITGKEYGPAVLTVTDLRTDQKVTDKVIVNSTGLVPSITVTPPTHNFNKVAKDCSKSKTFTVNYSNIDGQVALSRSGHIEMFSIDKQYVSNGEAFTVTYQPTKVGSHSMTINLNGGGIQETVTVTGECVVPSFTVAPTTVNLTAEKGKTATKRIAVSGHNIISPLSVTLYDNKNFSLTMPNGTSTISPTEANEGYQFTLEYHPVAAGTHSATITISGDGVETKTVSVTGTCPAVITASPKTIDLGTLALGQTRRHNVTVTTSVAGNLAISRFGATGYFKAQNESGTNISTVAAGDPFYVAFTPEKDGEYRCTYVISGGGATDTVIATGKCVTPSFTVSPTTVSMTAEKGKTVTQKIAVYGQNIYNSLNVTLSDVKNFSISKATITPTEANEGVVLTLSYHPTAAGTHTATLTISGDGVSSQTVKITGNCPAVITASPKTINLGTLAPGQSRLQKVSVNTSVDGNLAISRTGATGYFKAQDEAGNNISTVAAGSPFYVAFKPEKDGEYRCTYVISGGGASDTVIATGKCVTPSFTVSPTTVSMTAEKGKTVTQKIAVYGQNISNILNVTLSDVKNFSISKATITQTEANEGVELILSYHPTAAGTHTATLTISGDGVSSQTVKITGNCTAPQPSLNVNPKTLYGLSPGIRGTIKVTGSNLTENVYISWKEGSSSQHFNVSETSIPSVNGSVNKDVFVTFNPQNNALHATGTLIIKSGSFYIEVPVSGATSTPPQN